VRCSTGDNEAAAKVAVQYSHFVDQFELFALVMSQPDFGKGPYMLDWQRDFFLLYMDFFKGTLQKRS